MNNELCNKNNHEKNFVQKYNCEHNICLNCVKKCEKCKKKPPLTSKSGLFRGIKLFISQFPITLPRR